jgi:hypothetical protein
LFKTATGSASCRASQPHPLDQATVLEIARRVGRFTIDRVYESPMTAITLDFAGGQIMA